MEYRRFDQTIIARIDKGEEILQQVKKIAEKENIKLASVQALGAISSFTAGVFLTNEKKYMANDFQGTCEMVIRIIDGRVDRYFDEEVGLNLFRFN